MTRFIINILTFSIIATITACGGGSKSPINPSTTIITTIQEVGLLEEWTSSNNLSLIEDTSTTQLKTRVAGVGVTYHKYFPNGARCNCGVFSFFGTKVSGSFTRSSCQFLNDYVNVDPGCNSLNTTGTYSKSKATLMIIPENGIKFVFTSINKNSFQGKELRKGWSSSSILGFIKDTSTLQLKTSVSGSGVTYYQSFSNGARCNCGNFSFYGTQKSGSFVRSSCQFFNDNINVDPGCDSLNTTGTYSKNSDSLILTPKNEVSIIFN